jgi:hypothetical protein
MNEKLKIIQSHMAQLAEEFDTIQIFCTRKEEEGTASYFDGAGNWYARYGQIKAWTVAEERDMDTKNRNEEEAEW